jgi:hypothetical protein
MRSRVLVVLWALIGAAVWCGFFDLYVARGTRWYLQLHAEYELHVVAEEPSMAAMMERAKRDGAIAATLWAALVVGAGWTTVWLKGGSRTRSRSTGSL